MNTSLDSKQTTDLDARLLYIERGVISGLQFEIDSNSRLFIDTFNQIFQTIVSRETSKPTNIVDGIIIREIIKYITKNKHKFQIQEIPDIQPLIQSLEPEKKQESSYHYHYLFDNNFKNSLSLKNLHCKAIALKTLEYYKKYNITSDNNTFSFREVLPSEKLLLSEEHTVVLEEGYYTLEEFINTFNYIISQLETIGKYRLFYDTIACKFVLESHNITSITFLSILKTTKLQDNYFIIMPSQNSLNNILQLNMPSIKSEQESNTSWFYYSSKAIYWGNQEDYFTITLNKESIYTGKATEILPVQIHLNGLKTIDELEFISDSITIQKALLVLEVYR